MVGSHIHCHIQSVTLSQFLHLATEMSQDNKRARMQNTVFRICECNGVIQNDTSMKGFEQNMEHVHSVVCPMWKVKLCACDYIK